MTVPVRRTLEQVTDGVRAWRRKNVLDLDDFSREEIDLVFQTTDAMRDVLARPMPRVPALRGTTIMTMFYEPSTRTRASFERAGKVLSADVINLSASGSSVEKGESLVDTIRTLSALGADAIVMRHAQSGAPYLAAQHTEVSIINGGDGAHAHPSQALLDMYTILSKRGRLEDLKVVIVGDVSHSRVARSDIWGMTKMGARVTLCGPSTLMPTDVLRAYAGAGDRLAVEEDLDKVIEGADVVMALRLQTERQAQGFLPSIREYARRYQVNNDRLRRASPDVLVMHPGPMIEGVEISAEAARGLSSVVDEQVENGVAIRMALFYLTIGGVEG